MQKKLITIEIYEDGQSNIDLTGFQGVGCTATVEAFRGGDKVLSTKTKPEYSIQQQKQQTKVTQR